MWREEVEDTIKHCSVFILCWCQHAKKSKEVKKEYQLALNYQKRIVPLILEEYAPLPRKLQKLHKIDFSKEIKHITKTEETGRWGLVDSIRVGRMAGHVGAKVSTAAAKAAAAKASDQRHLNLLELSISENLQHKAMKRLDDSLLGLSGLGSAGNKDSM